MAVRTSSVRRGLVLVLVAVLVSVAGLLPESEVGANEVTGVVTETGTGTPLAGVEVRVYVPGHFFVWTTVTDATGSWTMPDVPATAGLRASFVDPAGVLGSEWWDDGSSPFTATTFSTAGGDVTGIDAVLDPVGPGSISGTVTEEGTGLPLAGVPVSVTEAFHGGTVPVASTVTDGTGDYSFPGLDPRGYWVRFGEGTTTLVEWLGDRSHPWLSDVADLSDGGSVVGDAALVKRGSISGTVTDALTAAPLPLRTVELIDDGGSVIGSTLTSAAGEYSFLGLRPDPYRLRFDGGATHAAEFWDDRPDLASSDPLTITVSEDLVADAGLAISTGVIEGTVTEEGSGLPIFFHAVRLYDDIGALVGIDFTDGTGLYSFTSVADGTYRVRFEDPTEPYVPEWYDDVPIGGSPTAVVLSGGGTVVADAALLPGPPIGLIHDYVCILTVPVGLDATGPATASTGGSVTVEFTPSLEDPAPIDLPTVEQTLPLPTGFTVSSVTFSGGDPGTFGWSQLGTDLVLDYAFDHETDWPLFPTASIDGVVGSDLTFTVPSAMDAAGFGCAPADPSTVMLDIPVL